MMESSNDTSSISAHGASSIQFQAYHQWALLLQIKTIQVGSRMLKVRRERQ